MRSSAWSRVVLVAALASAPVLPVAQVHATGDQVLPDLGMLAPTNFSIQSRPKGGRWLRFDSVVVNVGPGRFDAVGSAGTGTSERTVVQRIQLSGGSWDFLEAVETNNSSWAVIEISRKAVTVIASGTQLPPP